MKVPSILACALIAASMSACSHKEKKDTSSDQASAAPVSTDVQSESMADADDAQEKAADLTDGWPQSSSAAAAEMIEKHGLPTETTDDTLVWRNIAPFERITVRKEVHSSKFPVLHQNAVDHVVAYRAPMDKVEDVRRYNGSISIDPTKGEMTASGDSESMNILSLNLADEVMRGRLTPEEARTQYSKEALNLMNGQKSAATQELRFGRQFDTADKGKPMSDDMEWKNDQEDSIEAEEARPPKK